MRKGTISYLSEKTNYTMIDSASGSLITPAAYKTENRYAQRCEDEFRKFLVTVFFNLPIALPMLEGFSFWDFGTLDKIIS